MYPGDCLRKDCDALVKLLENVKWAEDISLSVTWNTFECGLGLLPIMKDNVNRIIAKDIIKKNPNALWARKFSL